MYDVERLERDWVKYKRKKILLPLLVIILLLGVLLVGLYLFLNRDAGSMKGAKNTQRTKISIQKTDQNRLSAKVSSVQKKDTAKSFRVKKNEFSDNRKDEADKSSTKKIKMIITDRKKSGNIAGDIKERFKSYHSEKDSLFLAKYYYSKGKYRKAEKWAYETNKINSDIEESWLIFAKAQAKQGKRLEALKLLKIFYDKSGSSRAKVLIDKIRRGKKY